MKKLTEQLNAVKPGETFSYTLEVTNRGDGRATNVEVTDMLPEQIKANLDETTNPKLSADGKTAVWTVGTVEAGETVSVSFTVTVKTNEELDALENGTMITNGAVITKHPPENPNTPANPEDEGDPNGPKADTETTPIFRIDVDKTAKVIPTGEFADVDNNPTTASLGDVIEFKVTVKNMGGIAAENIVITDKMISKAIDKSIVISSINDRTMVLSDVENNTMTVPVLEVGKMVEFTYRYKVVEADILAGSVNNVATAAADDPNGNDDPHESDDETETKTDPKTPKLDIVKEITSTNATYRIGETVEYLFTVTNTGNLTVQDMVITDMLVSGANLEGLTEQIALDGVILAPGESTTVTYAYTVQDMDVRPPYEADNVTIAKHWIDNSGVISGTASSGDEVIAESNMVRAEAKHWHNIVFVDTRTNEIIAMGDVPHGGWATAPYPPEHPGYQFVGWTEWVSENITMTQWVYALYERIENETILDADIPLAGGYISNVGDCFD